MVENGIEKDYLVYVSADLFRPFRGIVCHRASED